MPLVGPLQVLFWFSVLFLGILGVMGVKNLCCGSYGSKIFYLLPFLPLSPVICLWFMGVMGGNFLIFSRSSRLLP